MSTGRFFVVCKSGRKFCVEPYGESYVKWGNINPATKKLEIVKSAPEEIIDETNTIIKKENGFKNICFLEPGTSPFGYIEILDNSGIERIESDFVKYED